MFTFNSEVNKTHYKQEVDRAHALCHANNVTVNVASQTGEDVVITLGRRSNI